MSSNNSNLTKILTLGIGGILIIPVFFVIMIILIAMMLFAGSEEENGGEFGYDIDLSELGENEIPAQFIDFYKRAGEEYGIPWTLLAAIHRVETHFSTDKNDSYVGATGAMQFMPCTWVGWSHPTCSGLGKGNISKNDLLDPNVIKRYGGYGVDANGDGKADPQNEEDAIMSAANYLKANGADNTVTGMRKGVFAYNHATWYVDRVMGYFDSYTAGYKSVEIGGGVKIRGNKAYPVVGPSTITSTFGPRWGSFHSGIDIAPTVNKNGKTAIVSYADGKVIASNDGCGVGKAFHKCGGGYGNFVMIDHGGGIVTVYAHLAKGSVAVGIGKSVKAGDGIALMGNTGHSFGKHLHFEVKKDGKKIDPAPYLKGF